MPSLSTICIWVVALLSIAVAGLLAFVFVSIPLSLDPIEVGTAGSEPWVNALYAALGFAAVLVVSATGLRLWHMTRLRLALALMVAEVALVAWACGRVYHEYF